MPNNFRGFQTWGCLLNEGRTCRFIILFYVDIMSTLWHYVGRPVLEDFKQKLKSGNKIPIIQIAPEEKKNKCFKI